ncbi:MAG: hypothetical protein HY819_22945 [Acidobacteria bacterium]|nr:hypothetical protein [Acidobacteriota bacterium]
MRSRLQLILGCLLVLSLQFTVFAQKPKQLTNDDFSSPSTTAPSNKGEAPEDKLKSLIISLERSGCLGPCPVYKLTIYGSGKVVYRGEKFVKVVGERTTNIEREKIEKLIADFEKSSYFNLEDKYEGGPTDATSVVTSITLGNRKKTINNYHASPSSPAILRDLENKIDAIANSGQWLQ